MTIRTLLFLLIVNSLVACTSYQNYPTSPPQNAYRDDVIIPVTGLSVIEPVEQVFELPKEIESKIDSELLIIADYETRAEKLIKLFFSQDSGLSYQSNANFTAEEVQNHNAANCLSLTIYARAIANRANINTQISHIDMMESWTMENGYTLLNDHVHLKVMTKQQEKEPSNLLYIIDFISGSSNIRGSRTLIGDHHLAALFYNNKGAIALTRSNNKLAYSYLKASTQIAPNIANGWVNLATLYRRYQLYDLAEDIYGYALKLEPSNLNTLENLAFLYSETNRKEEANRLLKKIRKQRESNPYYQAMLAEQLFLDGDYLDSLTKFKQAIKTNPREFSFYFGVAKNYLALNQPNKAKRYSEQAQRLQRLLLAH